MTDAGTPRDRTLPLRALPLAQREIVLLVVLCIACAILFFGTRRMARWSRAERARAGAEWYAQGQRLAAQGNADASVAALREAVADDRDNAGYALALANVLVGEHRYDEAQHLFQQLRQANPDDVEVNHRLAQLAAGAGDVAEAVRYYNFAMYGLPRVGQDEERWRIRSELIALLIDHGDMQEAVTELGALGRELPDNPAVQLQAAHLATRAGDTRLALTLFAQAAVGDPTSGEAAAGMGEAAFALHDYSLAARELGRAVALGASTPQITTHAETAALVLSIDPLAPQLTTRQRARRLDAGFARAADRDDACRAASGSATKPGAARTQLDALRRASNEAAQDTDAMTRAVGVIGAVEADVAARCPAEVEPVDSAWRLVGATHSSGGL